MPLFLFIFYNLVHTFIQSHSHSLRIHRHSPSFLSISSSLDSSVWKAFLRCQAEIWTRTWLIARQRTTYQLSYAAPQNISCVQHIEISKPKKSKRTFLRRIHIDLMRKAEWREEYCVQYFYSSFMYSMCEYVYVFSMYNTHIIVFWNWRKK